MVKAIVERDESYVGRFVVAVRSTGIFCRPGCPARTPGEKQMEFFADGRDALHAGYRPCKRCRPLARTPELPPLVERLLALIEETPERKISYADLQSMNVDPSTARRQFQRHFGMSFNSYQRMRRLGMALKTIRDGETVLAAGYDSGYSSASGFRDAFTQLFGAPPSEAEQTSCLASTVFDTPIGPMLAIADDDALQLLEFVDRRRLQTEIDGLRKIFDSAIILGTNSLLKRVATEMAEYYDGRRRTFSVPVRRHGSDFQDRVWQALCGIPYGTTISYGELARRVGDANASRAVGSANGANQIAIVIPCHRVIRTDGALSGYGGKVWRKEWLIEHERSHTV